ncbi:hypothetical protein CKO28_16000 [Rhodovibrio sodomensis]|uniref:Tyr recombinase domain-containing protein n=1 Tax=Rhodovibrio sodomensis TaxID=1088 RepID=A0ABS1DHG0_9PROT|nr:site-specific integrase [Rhodovibrio sodomensis]MBK1669542.1 hypothetical protein [Rhodovibrio sodomensis]
MASVRKKTWTTKKGESSSWVVEWRDQNNKPRSRSFKKKRGNDPEEHADAFQRQVESRQGSGERTAVETRWRLQGWLEDYAERAGTIGIDGTEPVGTARKAQLMWAASVIGQDSIGSLWIDELNERKFRGLRDRLLNRFDKRKSAREVLTIAKSALEDARRHGHTLGGWWRDVSIAAQSSKKRVSPGEDGDDVLELPSRDLVRELLRKAKELRDDTPKAMGWEAGNEAWRNYTPTEGPRGWKDVQRAWRRNYVIVLMDAMTGLRQGEIRALYKTDLQLDREVVRVRRAADKDGNLKAPKTKAGSREVPLPAEVIRELRAWLAVAPEGPLLFPSARGGVMDRSNFYHRIWKALLKYAGEEECGLSFHALRHFYASSLIAAGMNAKEIQTTMGHSSIQVTYDIYGDLLEEDVSHRQAVAARAADALMSEEASER